ncbi:AcrR family transcriptional regulator [Novosphingobium sp. SG751A]|uniref:TetR/AcrR family transcriptional regulator n=1 Tax=Novosphingobium sp. SG751A TaxID=2587000 RepID=UPI0015547F0C|nr:TetR/AcrR family transcriptional regulator [Novosphingobium sp. SG751A]NOW45804.1 AcrR family transcriptional regulator [Novosphingobium sp. SG751A]
MRQKSDSRRQCILEAATSLFREVGFGRVSMAQISARVGGSKATLYSYFQSKEELFATAMIEAMEEQGQAMIDLLDPSEPDVRKVLQCFGETYVNFIALPQHLCCVRTAIAEGGTNNGLGATLYRLGPKRGWEEIAGYIAAVMERGNLPKGDAKMAAMHFKGMLESGALYPMLYGAEPELDTKTMVTGAVDAFLRAYG